jgi:hypothetical protein
MDFTEPFTSISATCLLLNIFAFTFKGLVSTGVPKGYKWSDGKNVSYPLPWCENEPTGTMKDVVMQTRCFQFFQINNICIYVYFSIYAFVCVFVFWCMCVSE